MNINIEKISNTKVLVVAAHADDEVLGCGGTIARHVANGDKVHVLIMSDGITSRENSNNIKKRKSEAIESAKILGIMPPIMLSLPDNKMDSIPILEIIKMVEKVIDEIKPSIVYTHHGGDLNIDHSITNRAVMTACRPVPEFSVNSIYCFEILSSTGWGDSETCKSFNPVHFVDISLFIEKKLLALECYTDEIRAFPHARSIEAVKALSKLRGSQSGLMQAEAFTVNRQIRKYIK